MVLLPQGKFTEFLIASDDDREALLAALVAEGFEELDVGKALEIAHDARSNERVGMEGEGHEERGVELGDAPHCPGYLRR